MKEIIFEKSKMLSHDYLVDLLEEMVSIKEIEKKTAEKFIKNIDNYLKFLEETKIICVFDKKEEIDESKPVNKTFENINKSAGNNFYKDFYISKRTNNIFLSSKLATSKDLFISNKYNKWITNAYSRARVHLLRANHDSILTTSKTILKDIFLKIVRPILGYFSRKVRHSWDNEQDAL